MGLFFLVLFFCVSFAVGDCDRFATISGWLDYFLYLSTCHGNHRQQLLSGLVYASFFLSVRNGEFSKKLA